MTAQRDASGIYDELIADPRLIGTRVLTRTDAKSPSTMRSYSSSVMAPAVSRNRCVRLSL